MEEIYVDFHCSDRVSKKQYNKDNSVGLIQIVKYYSEYDDCEQEKINDISIAQAEDIIN
jgi:hypothetical protein